MNGYDTVLSQQHNQRRTLMMTHVRGGQMLGTSKEKEGAQRQVRSQEEQEAIKQRLMRKRQRKIDSGKLSYQRS